MNYWISAVTLSSIDPQRQLQPLMEDIGPACPIGALVGRNLTRLGQGGAASGCTPRSTPLATLCAKTFLAVRDVKQRIDRGDRQGVYP
ncbi:hypothetical protein GCM10009612_62780 [Streptomyces beijiangensis]